MIFALLAGLLFAIWLPYQVHRRRTPFLVSVSSDADSIDISVCRRGFAYWPKEAAKELGVVPHRLHIDTVYLTVRTISVHDDDADEKMLETVVNTKATIEKWKTQRESANKLELQARKALNR